MNVAVVILAAGQSTRMKSRLPKVLHPLVGKPMISYGIETAARLGAGKPVLVVGHGMEQVRATVGEAAEYAVQAEQLGTGHAVLQARSLLEGCSDAVVVYYGDMPLLTVETLQQLLDLHAEDRSPITMLTLLAADPRGFGRIQRDSEGHVLGITEEVDCTAEQLETREMNAGVYCFEASWLWENLPHLQLSRKGEYYLTDTVAMAAAQGTAAMAVTTEDDTECLGINTRVHLAEAEKVMRQRINRKWMLAGVTLVDPATTTIAATVQIGQDTVIHANTHLQGATQIGRDCSIGPNSVLVDTIVGDRCQIKLSVTEQARLEDDVDIGPFAHLRKGAHLARGVHMGNFGEVKNSYLGPGVKMGHFSYLGDATVGADANIGAGTITCNYDGQRKHRTIIEEGAFIGSDTMLVAPLRVGAGARTGAGSVVTHDVPPGSTAYGVPARVSEKLDRDTTDGSRDEGVAS
jgi:bifunctional UDP-N-acetylglucosamine pyrophosphorylase/glucosamine-1-phosphate N-acetyltransferase